MTNNNTVAPKFNSTSNLYEAFLSEEIKEYFDLRSALLTSSKEEYLVDLAVAMNNYYIKYKKTSFSIPYAMFLLIPVLVMGDLTIKMPSLLRGFCWGVIVTTGVLIYVKGLQDACMLFPFGRTRFKTIVERKYQKLIY